MRLLSRDPVPQEKRDEIGRLESEFAGLKGADSERLERFREYREEMEASRTKSLFYSTGSRDDYRLDQPTSSDKPPRHQLSIPFGMTLTVKHSYRMAGRMPDAIVDRREESTLERYRSDTMEKIWWSAVRASGEGTLFSTGAHDGSQLGASCYEPHFSVGAQQAVIQSVDPAGVLVVRGLVNPHDFERVYRFWHAPLATVRAQYRGKQVYGADVDTEGMESTHKAGNVPMATLVECKEKHKTTRFCAGAENDAVPLMEHTHNLGFVPFVVIPNLGPYRDVWGWSDYEFVRSLVHYFPKLLSREADVIRSVANGAYFSKATGQEPHVIEGVIQNGGVLDLKRDGEVGPIDPPAMPEWIQNHRESILEALKMVGFTPDAAWGGSDTRSGQDRKLQLQPQVELTAMKQMNWSEGLARLGSMVFQITEQKMAKEGVATYRGSRPSGKLGNLKGYRPFKIGPSLEAAVQTVTEIDEMGDEVEKEVEFPRTPRDLFQGDYAIRFVYQNRIDPDDPAYILAELNKFQVGAQSLRTTLENLGFEFPEDEINLIEEEAHRFPWLRDGMIAQIKSMLAQLDGASQGQGAGGGGDTSGRGSGLGRGLAQSGLGDGQAMDAYALSSGLGSNGLGQRGV